MSESTVSATKSCEIDFVTAVCLLRRRPEEGERFDLSKLVGRSSFLLQRDPVISDLLIRMKRVRPDFVGR